MDELKELKEKVRKEKSRLEVQEAMEKRSQEKAEAKRELKRIERSIRANKYKPILSFAKKTGSVLGRIGDNLSVNQEAAEHNIHVGHRIMIKNGVYSGQEMRVDKLISGGVEGKIMSSMVRIRHGSYSKI